MSAPKERANSTPGRTPVTIHPTRYGHDQVDDPALLEGAKAVIKDLYDGDEEGYRQWQAGLLH